MITERLHFPRSCDLPKNTIETRPMNCLGFAKNPTAYFCSGGRHLRSRIRAHNFPIPCLSSHIEASQCCICGSNSTHSRDLGHLAAHSSRQQSKWIASRHWPPVMKSRLLHRSINGSVLSSATSSPPAAPPSVTQRPAFAPRRRIRQIKVSAQFSIGLHCLLRAR